VRERPFGQLAFARLFYQEAKQHQSYQESLAFAEKGE
jgi:hypothetical protein